MASNALIADFKHRFKRLWIHLFILLRRIRLPGFKGVGLYDVLRFFLRAMGDRRFTMSAADMAYRFFFSLFPGLIFILTLIPLLNIPNLTEDTVMVFFETFTPPESLGFVKSVVGEFFVGKYFGLLSFNFALMLFTALSGIRAMMRGFSKADLMLKRRGFFRQYGVALMIFFVLLTLFLITLVVWILGEYFVSFLNSSDFLAYMDSKIPWIEAGIPYWVGQIVHWIIVLLTLFFTISIVYYLAPDNHKRFNFFSPGALTAGFLSLVAIVAFRYFIVHFDQINKVYGSLSAIMILMVWFYWLSMVLLIGFELNAAIDLARLDRKMRLRTRQESESITEGEPASKKRKKEQELLEKLARRRR